MQRQKKERQIDMSWYAASIIMYMKFKDGVQNIYPIWENVVLIEADSSEEALDKAERRGKSDVNIEGGDTYDDRPVVWVFGGIRKLIVCVEPEEQPKDGTEVTYSDFIVYDEDSLKKMIDGETVNITYDE